MADISLYVGILVILALMWRALSGGPPLSLQRKGLGSHNCGACSGTGPCSACMGRGRVMTPPYMFDTINSNTNINLP